MEISEDLFQVFHGIIGSPLIDLCEIWFGGSLGWKLRDDQQRIPGVFGLLAFLAVDFKSTYLSAVIHV